MRPPKYAIAVTVLTGVIATSALLVAQGGAPPPAPQGRGAGPGQGGGGGGRGGGRRGGFPQFTRELAPQEVIVRGKGVYETNCASCHASDIRGSANGANLMRSGLVLSDEHGDLLIPSVAGHKPALTLANADVVAVAEYLHSIQATTGPQGSPPGRFPQGLALNVLVGDVKAGEEYFKRACSACHSVTGDLAGIGSKFADARALQNAWVSGSSSPFGGGGGGGRGAVGVGSPATVTMADGSKVEGTLVRRDDWLVILTLPDGTRKSIARNNGLPKVDVKDRQEPHKKMVLELDDPENRNLHDVTAYLATIK